MIQNNLCKAYAVEMAPILYLFPFDVELGSFVIIEFLLRAKLGPRLLCAMGPCTGTHETAEVGVEKSLVGRVVGELESPQTIHQTRVATGPKFLHLLLFWRTLSIQC